MRILGGVTRVLLSLWNLFRGLLKGIKGKAGRVRKRKRRSKRVKKARYEFGSGSKLAYPIRIVLRRCPAKWCDSSISGRLSGRLYKMIREGSGEEGRRSFEVANFDMLNGFPLHEKKPRHAFFCTDDRLLQVDRNSLTARIHLHFWELQGFFGVKFREYHKLVLGILALSEVHYDVAKNAYRYSHSGWNARAAFAESAAFGEMTEGDKLELEVRLEAAGKLPERVGLVGIVGVT